MSKLWARVQQLEGRDLQTTGPGHLPFRVLAVTDTRVDIERIPGKKRSIQRQQVESAADQDVYGDAWTVTAVVSKCPTTRNASYIAGILCEVTQ